MRTVNATDVRHQLGTLMSSIKVEPVLIKKNGKPIAVMLSIEEFERLQELEDSWWGEQAKKAAEEGLLTEEETKTWLMERLNETADH